MQPVVLEVVDAETMLPLSDLLVVGEGAVGAWELHPGYIIPERIVARGARSPVELPIPDDPEESERLWARAPGYGIGSAWRGP